jgi:hypothetical protein
MRRLSGLRDPFSLLDAASLRNSVSIARGDIIPESLPLRCPSTIVRRGRPRMSLDLGPTGDGGDCVCVAAGAAG